jgi:hypothetical protein
MNAAVGLARWPLLGKAERIRIGRDWGGKRMKLSLWPKTMKWNLDKPSTRRRMLYAAFTLMAVGYIILPIYLGLSDMQTDMVASVLLALAVGVILYEDHRGFVLPALLVGSVLICFLAVLFAAIAILWNGVRFQALIPVCMLTGGIAYWYLDRRRISTAANE